MLGITVATSIGLSARSTGLSPVNEEGKPQDAMNDVKAATGCKKRAKERPVIGARARALPRVSAESPPGVTSGGISSVRSPSLQVMFIVFLLIGVYDLNFSLISLV
jgi:hypothetical protein